MKNQDFCQKIHQFHEIVHFQNLLLVMNNFWMHLTPQTVDILTHSQKNVKEKNF